MNGGWKDRLAKYTRNITNLLSIVLNLAEVNAAIV